MNTKKVIGILVGGALVLVSVFGAVGYGVVKAQTVAATATPVAGPPNSNQPGPGNSQAAGRYTDADLATALGITTNQLTTARQSATADALKQAVTAGLITQAQADQYTQANANGNPGGNLPFLKNSTIDYEALLAKALGISSDALKAGELKATQTNLAAAVKAGTITQDQADLAQASAILTNNTEYQAAIKSGNAAALKQAVTDGVITQAQADLITKNGAGGRSGPQASGAPANPSAGSSTHTDFITLLAKALGISTDTLNSAYQKAYTAQLDESVKAGTMTQDQADQAKATYALQNSTTYQAALKASADAALKQAVSIGAITQAQADLIVKNGSVVGAGNPGGRGGQSGPGGGRGGAGGPGGQPPATGNPNGTAPNSNNMSTTNP